MKHQLLVIIFTVGILFGHDHWIDCETFYPAPGQTATIRICSGHYYPESALAIKERLIDESSISNPSGNRNPLPTEPVGMHREGIISFPTPGTYLVQVVLKRSQLSEPDYRMKAIIIAGGETPGEVNYSLGEGLEIVPVRNLGMVNIGDTLPLQAFYDGKPVQGTFTVSVDGKKNFNLSTDRSGLANLRIDRGGKYLVTFHHLGKGCSLTYELNLKSSR